jgi:hypothetical protein
LCMNCEQQVKIVLLYHLSNNNVQFICSWKWLTLFAGSCTSVRRYGPDTYIYRRVTQATRN